MIVDTRIRPGHISCAARHLTDVLLDLLSIAILLSVFLEVHAVLGVDVADVADLGGEVAITRDTSEAGSSVPRSLATRQLSLRCVGAAGGRSKLVNVMSIVWDIGSPGVVGSIGSPALSNSHNRIGELVLIILQGHLMLGL